MSVEDRIVGCVLGLALGDALGAPFVGRRASKAAPDPSPAGATTAVTALARNLVCSLTASRGFDPQDIVRRHVEWLDATDRPRVDSLTPRVLARVARGEQATSAAQAEWEERGPEISASNGSVVYCAPLGVAHALNPERLEQVAPALSALTHHDGRCRTAVLAVCLAAAHTVRGEPGPSAVHQAIEAVIDREGGEELEFLVDAAGVTRPVDGPDRSFCLFTGGLGLQALARHASFEVELRRVVALGGDTSANAAVAGALVGAAVGRTGLPASWLESLDDREAIEREAESLAALGAAPT
jgi:ADP-ribosylglycohydrolase